MANNFSETTRLMYDPSLVTFSDLMDYFWKITASPWMPSPDPAYQLRVFAVDDSQYTIAQQSLATRQAQPDVPKGVKVQLEIVNASDYTFWKAEEYHQHYFLKMGEHCGQDGARRLARSDLSGGCGGR